MNDSSSWFRIETAEDNCQRIRFLPSKDRYWSPNILSESPIPLHAITSEKVILTGPGAIWMYANCAAYLAAKGIVSIEVQHPFVAGMSNDTSDCICQWVDTKADRDCRLLKIDLPRSDFSTSALDRLVAEKIAYLRSESPRELVLIGRASNWLYAKASEAAIGGGAKRLMCWSARDGLVEVFNESLPAPRGSIEAPLWVRESLPRPERSMVLGVIGDPNLGKSLFSECLDLHRATVRYDGWRLDCDGQSPTPPWYLSMTSTDRWTEAGQLRMQNKIPWTDEMELQIAAQLRTARELFPVLIADLPGGNLKISPPQRIPRGRERILREVDSFILLDREENPSEAAWREEFRQHVMEQKIVAVIQSKYPAAMPSFQLRETGGIVRGVVTGLDRSKYSTEFRYKAFQSEMNRLWEFLIRGNMPTSTAPAQVSR